MTDVRPITPADVTVAARTLARAFAEDPVMAWLTGDRPARFAKVGRGFFAAEARRMSALGGGWITADGNGAALWSPPDHWKVGFLDTVRLVPSSARLYGLRLPRAARVLGSMEERHPREPYWYLSVLGTDPDMQGKGLGSALLAPVLVRCDRDGLPAYLESSNERNVPFYERHGFAVTGTHTFPNGPSLTEMWRKNR